MKAAALVVLFCFNIIFQVNGNEPPKIDINSMVDCKDEKVTPPHGFVCETNIAGEGPAKSLTAKVTMPFDLDDSVTYRASIKRWTNGEWKQMSFKLSGKVCEHAQKYLPGIWEKLSKVLNLPPDCPVKAGTFSVNDFKAEAADVKLPLTVTGKYLVSAIVSKDDTPIACKQSEIVISKP